MKIEEKQNSVGNQIQNNLNRTKKNSNSQSNINKNNNTNIQEMSQTSELKNITLKNKVIKI